MRDIVQRGYFVSEKQTITVTSFFCRVKAVRLTSVTVNFRVSNFSFIVYLQNIYVYSCILKNRVFSCIFVYFFLKNRKELRKFEFQFTHKPEFPSFSATYGFLYLCIVCYIETSRDRPKSAPYPRLKNSKKTSKCQVFVYSSRNSKIFRKFFF